MLQGVVICGRPRKITESPCSCRHLQLRIHPLPHCFFLFLLFIIPFLIGFLAIVLFTEGHRDAKLLFAHLHEADHYTKQQHDVFAHMTGKKEELLEIKFTLLQQTTNKVSPQ